MNDRKVMGVYQELSNYGAIAAWKVSRVLFQGLNCLSSGL